MKKYIALYSDNGELKGECFEKKYEAIDRCRDFPYLGKQFSICVANEELDLFFWCNSMLKMSEVLRYINQFNELQHKYGSMLDALKKP